mmetsp:Transcript_93124/g.268989  ORF Transcript_93124/g.268989 Transcript_93124/m.268989 type:complete len:240 (-) Transcript_93124:370-1089(-)
MQLWHDGDARHARHAEQQVGGVARRRQPGRPAAIDAGGTRRRCADAGPQAGGPRGTRPHRGRGRTYRLRWAVPPHCRQKQRHRPQHVPQHRRCGGARERHVRGARGLRTAVGRGGRCAAPRQRRPLGGHLARRSRGAGGGLGPPGGRRPPRGRGHEVVDAVHGRLPRGRHHSGLREPRLAGAPPRGHGVDRRSANTAEASAAAHGREPLGIGRSRPTPSPPPGEGARDCGQLICRQMRR